MICLVFFNTRGQQQHCVKTIQQQHSVRTGLPGILAKRILGISADSDAYESTLCIFDIGSSIICATPRPTQIIILNLTRNKNI